MKKSLIAVSLAALTNVACATSYGPVYGFEPLPNPIFPGGVISGFPQPTNGQVRIQSGTGGAPLTNGEFALNSQAIVNAPSPYNSASVWSPNEFSVINKGHGRVNAVNNVIITEQQLDLDNSATFSYAKSKYQSGQSVGGVVGHWVWSDVRDTPTRVVGGEFVVTPGSVDYLDNNPAGGLTVDPSQYSSQGAFSIGLRVSSLLGNKLIPRGVDIIADNGNSGFDTGLSIHSYRSRAIYVNNSMSSVRGGARTALEASSNVPQLFKWSTDDGTPLSFEQNYSNYFGQKYYVYRKDANQTWLQFFPNGTITFSVDNNYGARLVVYPDGVVKANHSQTPSFMVKQSGKFYLSEDRQTYIDYNGANVRIVKNGNVVAQW